MSEDFLKRETLSEETLAELTKKPELQFDLFWGIFFGSGSPRPFLEERELAKYDPTFSARTYVSTKSRCTCDIT